MSQLIHDLNKQINDLEAKLETLKQARLAIQLLDVGVSKNKVLEYINTIEKPKPIKEILL